MTTVKTSCRISVAIVEASNENLSKAAELIRNGGLVAFPTETVYGLGTNALDHDAVQRIYFAKGRPSTSPLIVHVADVAMARSLSSAWPEMAEKLALRYWPGPLTLVVPKASAIPGIVTAGLMSVGLRIPAHPVALELIRRAGVPIAAPSANRFMAISPTTAQHVEASLGDKVDMILDGGPTSVGIESTVVSFARETPGVLRPGMISHEELLLPLIQAEGISEAPGQHEKHYSPRTPFYLLNKGQSPPQGCGYVILTPESPARFAAELYATLHKADAQGFEWIAVETPPDTPEWAAVNDRIKRAACRRD